MKEFYPSWAHYKLLPLVSTTELKLTISYLAERVDAFFSDSSNPVVLGVLRGSFIFLADLVRELASCPAVDFIWPQRYEGEQGGEVRALAFPEYNLKGAHVVVVDDILDEGHTLRWVLNWVRAQEPAKVATCVLFNKTYLGVTESLPTEKFLGGIHIPSQQFIVGYGMDYKEKGRNLPEVYFLDKEGA